MQELIQWRAQKSAQKSAQKAPRTPRQKQAGSTPRQRLAGALIERTNSNESPSRSHVTPRKQMKEGVLGATPPQRVRTPKASPSCMGTPLRRVHKGPSSKPLPCRAAARTHAHHSAPAAQPTPAARPNGGKPSARWC